uniref:Uncharacterized protein n=1 Tax=Anopheles merus TaxID=30066 RepID=A0A182UYT2_ANOME
MAERREKSYSMSVCGGSGEDLLIPGRDVIVAQVQLLQIRQIGETFPMQHAQYVPAQIQHAQPLQRHQPVQLLHHRVLEVQHLQTVGQQREAGRVQRLRYPHVIVDDRGQPNVAVADVLDAPLHRAQRNERLILKPRVRQIEKHQADEREKDILMQVDARDQLHERVLDPLLARAPRVHVGQVEMEQAAQRVEYLRRQCCDAIVRQEQILEVYIAEERFGQCAQATVAHIQHPQLGQQWQTVVFGCNWKSKYGSVAGGLEAIVWYQCADTLHQALHTVIGQPQAGQIERMRSGPYRQPAVLRHPRQIVVGRAEQTLWLALLRAGPGVERAQRDVVPFAGPVRQIVHPTIAVTLVDAPAPEQIAIGRVDALEALRFLALLEPFAQRER